MSHAARRREHAYAIVMECRDEIIKDCKVMTVLFETRKHEDIMDRMLIYFRQKYGTACGKIARDIAIDNWEEVVR